MVHVSLHEMHQQLDYITLSPENNGEIKMLVRRPDVNMREELTIAELDKNVGLVGDNWQFKPSSSMPNGEAHPEKQITLMNSRSIEVIAKERSRWALAGDQVFVDLNLGYQNLIPGTRLIVGTAVLQVSEPPHRGCKKFAERFGQDAMRFVNSDAGRELNLRGINCKVIRGGIVKLGDIVQKIPEEQTHNFSG